MESLPNYDSWKLATPPRFDDDPWPCVICGVPVFDGSEICDDCGDADDDETDDED